MVRVQSLTAAAALLAATTAFGQPERPPAGGQRGGDPTAAARASLVKVMRFDADGNGDLSKEEVSDPRLQALFQRADADKDGVATKAEWTALFGKEAEALRAGGPGGGPGSGRGPAGPGGGGPGAGMGGPPGGPPRFGTILPSFVQDELELTERQRANLAAIQK
ncbi:MAG: hypothetical protein ACRDD1_17395, partial [Planctomycetia bacterium]